MTFRQIDDGGDTDKAADLVRALSTLVKHMEKEKKEKPKHPKF